MLVNIVFFVTPIFWRKEMLAERGLLAEFNPFFHFIEIVRAPLLGQAPPLRTWFAVAAITAVGWAATLVVFSAYRRRIAYWL
jgi:ABC-2 type transport system permease protein/lipopolysaccharide transport system permease protein